eukprot:Em0020g966a
MAAARPEVGRRVPPPVAAYSVKNSVEGVDILQGSTPANGTLKGNERLKEPQLAGTLYKMGRRLKGWHERYYELKGTELVCYKDATKQALSGTIDLLTCTRVGISRPSSYGFTFEIQAPDRTHVFAVRSAEERDLWKKTITDLMAGSKTSDGHKVADDVGVATAETSTPAQSVERRDQQQSATSPDQSAIESLRELLKSLPEGTILPPTDPSEGEEEWRKQPTAIEQLRHFLVTCP